MDWKDDICAFPKDVREIWAKYFREKEFPEKGLCGKAHALRLKSVGPNVHLRAIIEFSNYCRQDCLFCGLRRSNTNVRRYRMTPDEIIEACRKIMEVHSFGTIVLQSGEDPIYPNEGISKAIKAIKDMGTAVTLSLGQRTKEEYRAWKEAGADRYLLKFETGDEGLFRRIKPTTTLSERMRCLKNLQDLGYQVGSGIILGLPGQTRESVLKDLHLIQELDLDMVSIGPFIPHPDTPLGRVQFKTSKTEVAASLDTQKSRARRLIQATIKAIAMARLMAPMAHIPGTTALEVLGKEVEDSFDARSLALVSGANVIMPDLTPKNYRDAYEIYPGKSRPHWDMVQAVLGALDLVASVGMEVDGGRGDSPKAKKQLQGRG